MKKLVGTLIGRACEVGHELRRLAAKMFQRIGGGFAVFLGGLAGRALKLALRSRISAAVRAFARCAFQRPRLLSEDRRLVRALGTRSFRSSEIVPWPVCQMVSREIAASASDSVPAVCGYPRPQSETQPLQVETSEKSSGRCVEAPTLGRVGEGCDSSRALPGEAPDAENGGRA